MIPDPIRPHKPELLMIFDRLIEDYICLQRSPQWRFDVGRFDVAHNFGHSHASLDGAVMAESLSETKKRVERFEAAEQVIHSLEYVLNGFIQFADSFKALRAALPSLLFASTDQWEQHCNAQPQPQRNLIEYSVQTGFVESLFRYLLKDIVISDEMKKRMQDFKIRNYIRLHGKENLPFTPNEESQALLNRIYPIFDQELGKCIEWANRLKQKQGDQLLPILGIGYSGNHLNPSPVHEKCEVFVSFTYRILHTDQVSSQAFLLAAGAFLEACSKYKNLNTESWTLQSKFQSLVNDNPKFHLHVLDQQKNEEQAVINYIGENKFCDG